MYGAGATIYCRADYQRNVDGNKENVCMEPARVALGRLLISVIRQGEPYQLLDNRLCQNGKQLWWSDLVHNRGLDSRAGCLPV